MTSTGMNNLTTLIKRLEAATSRLEDIATSAASFDAPQTNGLAIPSSNPTATASAPELPGINKSVPTAPPTPNAPSVPDQVADLDQVMEQDVTKFVNASKELDSTISEQASAIGRAFQAQRQYVFMSTKAKKPDMSSPAFATLISSLQHELGAVNDIKDSNRGSQYKDHLAMVSEGTGALQWIVMDGKPADYVNEVIGGVQLYGNRILKAYKEKDQAHVTYVQSYVAIWKSLQTYIKKHYMSGLTWNNSGLDLADALKQGDGAPTTNGAAPPAPPPPGAAGGPAPPPPPPPLPTFDAPAPSPAAKSGGAGDMGAVFDALNKGEAVTAGLRKVDKSEMTHKNPSLRTASVVPDRSRSPKPETKPKPDAMRTKSGPTPKKEGKKELDGNKWYIENFEDPAGPIEIEVSLSQSILISRCKNTTVILKGKANAVSIDNCSRTNLVIDSLVSSVDVVKCPNFALQVLESLPTVMLDQVDGAAIYLSKDSLHTELYTSKCTSINVNLPPAREEDDYKECPLPEQIRTFLKDGQLVSEIVQHAG